MCSTFSSNHPGTRLYEVIQIPDIGAVTMVPDHCVQGTWGSKFNKDLFVDETDIIVHYGFDPRVDQSECLGEVSQKSVHAEISLT
jgi:nicotinamidase/pyrazinamidase